MTQEQGNNSSTKLSAVIFKLKQIALADDFMVERPKAAEIYREIVQGAVKDLEEYASQHREDEGVREDLVASSNNSEAASVATLSSSAGNSVEQDGLLWKAAFVNEWGNNPIWQGSPRPIIEWIINNKPLWLVEKIKKVGGTVTTLAISVAIHGCDDSTEFNMEVTESEFDLLEKVAKLSTETSTYGCMPTITISRLNSEQIVKECDATPAQSIGEPLAQNKNKPTEGESILSKISSKLDEMIKTVDDSNSNNQDIEKLGVQIMLNEIEKIYGTEDEWRLEDTFPAAEIIAIKKVLVEMYNLGKSASQPIPPVK